MYKNILAPVDLKSRSRIALRQALHLAHQFDAKIFLLSIHEDFRSKDQMVMSRVSVNMLGEEYKKIALDAKKDMKNLVNQLEEDDVGCEYILRDGLPTDIILKIAVEYNIDLIVMGTNGRDSLSDFILGTTTQKVVEHSTCPVLVVPKGKYNE